MRRIVPLVLGIAIGGGLMWGAFNYHLLRTDSGFSFVAKRSANLTDVYCDTRAWSLADWHAHPDLVLALVNSGRTEVIAQGGGLEATLRGILKKPR